MTGSSKRCNGERAGCLFVTLLSPPLGSPPRSRRLLRLTIIKDSDGIRRLQIVTEPDPVLGIAALVSPPARQDHTHDRGACGGRTAGSVLVSASMLHRTRHLFIRQQTAVINAIRAHLAEFGIVAPVGRNGVDELGRPNSA
jgi:hypothetical protein